MNRKVCVCVCACVCIQVDKGCLCSLYRLVFQDSVLSPRLPQVGSSQLQTNSVHCFTVLPPLILWIISESNLENVFLFLKNKSPLLWIFISFPPLLTYWDMHFFRLWERALFMCTKLLNCFQCVFFFCLPHCSKENPVSFVCSASFGRKMTIFVFVK